MLIAGRENVNAPTELSRSDTASTERRIENLARSSIALSQLAPELAGIASRLASGAQQQASQARDIAVNVEKMASELATAMSTLDHSSGSVGDIVKAIKRVADQTRILSINASIEAARAGEFGLAFGAVAHEVESLAGQTKKATGEIADSVDSIRDNITRVVDAAGLHDDAASDRHMRKSGFSIHRLGSEVGEMADIATDTAKSAAKVDESSGQIRSLCEKLLIEVGTFRLPAHERAVNIFRRMLGMREFAENSRNRCEHAMRTSLRDMRIFELLYLTNANGHQITSNMWVDGREDTSVYGRDWSDRPWFQKVLESGEITVSDIYRSSATDSFCFTISGPVFDLNGDFSGVLAADVNFAGLLSL